MNTTKPICPYCKEEAELIESTQYYTNSTTNYGKMWICWNCDAYVGCHRGTDIPLGTLANFALRQLRIECHGKIDPLWRSGYMTRSEVYTLISKQLGLTRDEMHIGLFDEEMCNKLLALELTIKL